MSMFRPAKFIRKSYSSPLRALGSLVVLAAIVILILELTNVTHIFHKNVQSSKTVVTAGTPVQPPASKPASSQPPPKSSTNTSSPSRNNGTATDTQGNATANTNSSQWITSASGVITVKQPTANSKISDGSVLSGTAKVSQINYRLSDNEVGVIAQGNLSVVGGSFSGTLHFTPRGTGGRLDVFTTDSQGVEYNEIQINVSF